MSEFRWAIIDLETSGLHVKHDKIIEIAVLIINESGVIRRWHSLINPQMLISHEITQLTGIQNEMLDRANCFGDIAADLVDILQDCILVAHNIRFDYGFLKNAFKSAGIVFKAKHFCTIKLMRSLYPTLKRYNLSFLSEHFGFCAQQHRALEDVELVHQLLNKCISDFTLLVVLEKINTFLNKASVPSGLTTDVNLLPKGPGVYLFYSKLNSLPIYIGKSVSLRQRILSHFQADHSNSKEFKLAQQVHRVETIETSGELSALLLESKLIKELMPLYNYRLRRKKKIVGFLTQAHNSYLGIKLSTENPDHAPASLLGAFTSVRAAQQSLYDLAKKYKLCYKLCGLEKTKQACFSYHLHICQGACIDKESPEAYNLRVSEALAEFQHAAWPYPAGIAIKEESKWLIFNNWQHINTVEDLSLVNQSLLNNPPLQNDRDCYLILKNFLSSQQDKATILSIV